MPVLYFFALLVIVALYLGYLACAVPVAAIIAFTVYSLWLPAAYVAALWRVLVKRPAGLPGRKRVPKKPPDADPATLQYFYGPAVADADHAIRLAYSEARGQWQRGARKVKSYFYADAVILTAPLGVGGAIGMVAGTVAGAVAAVGCALVHLIVLGISTVFVRVAGIVLRRVDSTVLRIKNIRMICPNPECYERVPYPGYECPRPTCPRRHHDVRPGRFGILRRHCECGEPMQTLLLFGSARMDAYCPHCGESLEHRPGKVPEIVLPFFGAIGAGKTLLLFGMAAQLLLWHEQWHEQRSAEERFAIEFADTATAGKLKDAITLLGQEGAIPKTLRALPRADVVRVTSGRDTRLLHMFDAAGEYFNTSDGTQELRYLGKARTFVLVIDPLSVEAFWDRLIPEQQARLKGVRSAAASPELAYQQAHQEIEAMGVRLRKTRLAVVFSRADLIDAPGDDVATWATNELGLGNLVRSARLNFGEACFFQTAAVILPEETVHESVAPVLRWVLTRNGVDLPSAMST